LLSAIPYPLTTLQNRRCQHCGSCRYRCGYGLAEKVVVFAAAPGSTAVVDAVHGFITVCLQTVRSPTLLLRFCRNYRKRTFCLYPNRQRVWHSTKAELIRDADGKVMETYTIVIFGDIDGDGLRTAMMLSCKHACRRNADAGRFERRGVLCADATMTVLSMTLTTVVGTAGLFLAEISQTVI